MPAATAARRAVDGLSLVCLASGPELRVLRKHAPAAVVEMVEGPAWLTHARMQAAGITVLAISKMTTPVEAADSQRHVRGECPWATLGTGAIVHLAAAYACSDGRHG